MSKPILTATAVHKFYQMGKVPLHVLRGCSISVKKGEFVCIMGSSGSGKSTLLHILGALDVPGRGKVEFEKHDLFAGGTIRRDRLRNEMFGFVFQFYHLLPDLNVMENVLLPNMVKHSIRGWFRHRGEHRAHAADLLERFGLGQRLRHRPKELSGGERQRVAIARALANRPRVLLADEPTGNLDAATGREIMAVLRDLNESGQTIVMVTHDAAVAESAHRTVHLVDGRIVD